MNPNPLIRALATDSVAGSFTAEAPTATEPSGPGIFSAEGCEELQVFPYGTGSDNDTFNIQVIGWRKYGGGAVPLWVPVEIATLACTVGTQVGVANADINASHRFADTITLTSGIAVIPSITPNTCGYFVVDLTKYSKVEILFDRVLATACNALLARD